MGLNRSAIVGAMALLSLAAQAEDEWDTLFAEPQATPAPALYEKSVPLPAEPEPQVTPARRKPMLEEVIVTAQRRQESQQDTPISLAAFNAEQLRVAGVDGLADLGSNVPSLQIEPFPTSNATLRFYIRGIGVIDAQVTQDPAVGVYMDGVYIARSTGTAFDVADLERVEILRGPQGTLYGRNTTGGAINIITERPSTDESWMRQSLTVGDRNHLSAKTSLNLPLSDDLAMKLALVGSMKDGFVENTGPGGDYGDRQTLSTRFDLRWEPDERWTVDYSYDRGEIDFYNYSYQAVLTPEGNKGQVEQVKREAQANSIYSFARLRAMATGAPLEPSATLINGHAITLQHRFDLFDVKYIAAYRDLYEAFYTDLGGGAGSLDYRLDTHAYDGPAATALQGGPTALNVPFIRQDQWSHEVQMLGSIGPVEYVAGLFYFTESAVEDWMPIAHQFSAAINPLAAQAILGDAAREAAPRLVAFTSILNETENESGALFGQATWTPQRWDQRLHLTLGYRHSEDRRYARKTKFSPSYAEANIQGEGTAAVVGSPVAIPRNDLTDILVQNVTLLGGDTFDHVPGRFGFSDDSFSFVGAYDFADAINLYGKYVEAYKSGGFNTRDPQIDGNSGPATDGNDYGYGFADGFDKELVKSLEFGIKSEWLERRLRLNADLFYTAYQDMQVNFILAGTISDTKTTNAGKARMWGFEMDGNYLLHADLRLDASYAYLNAAITEVVDVNGEDVTELYQFNSAPEHSLSLSADWTFARLAATDLSLNLSYQYTGTREGAVNSRAPLDLRAYQLLNAYLSTGMIRAGASAQFSLGLWLRNALDEVYEINAIDNLPHADRAVIWGEPRSYGLDFKLAF